MRNYRIIKQFFLGFPCIFRPGFMFFFWEKNPRKQWILGIECQVEKITLIQFWKCPAMFATFVLAKTQNYLEMGQTWVPNWQFWGVDSVDMF